MKKLLYLVFTSLIIVNFAVCAVFADSEDPDTFTDFVDNYGSNLIDITSSTQTGHLKFTVNKSRVYDHVEIETSQGRMATLTPNNNTLYFTGSYYDNTITGLEGCSSSAYQYNTSAHTIDGVITVEPAVYGSLQHSSHNMILNFGLDVSSSASASETVTTSSFENATQACALIGMNTGDGAIDGTTLIEAGYEQQTITYNDGTLAGHTATFYVPGDEEFSFALDSQYLTNLISGIVINYVNNFIIDYHWAVDIGLTSDGTVAVPEYGFLKSYSWLPLMFDYSNYVTDGTYGTVPDTQWYRDPAYSDSAYFAYNPSFYRTTGTTDSGNTFYKNNYTFLRWEGNNNPHWYIRSNGSRANWSTLSTQNTFFNNHWGSSSYEDLISTTSYFQVTTAAAALHSNLTEGYYLPVDFSFYDYKFFKLQDTSRLGLFNQLGSFLQTQFNRLKNAIDGISGTDGDLVVDIENNYDIDVDQDINNYITNVFDKKDDIDLTQPEFTLPSDNNLNLFADVPLETLKIFTDNKLGIFIFLPLLIALLGMIL